MGDFMFNKHLIIDNKDEQVLYLFIDYNYEFGNEFLTSNEKKRSTSLFKHITDYIKEHKISFKGTKVFLVVNGIIISSFILSGFPYRNQTLIDEITPKYQYVEYLKPTEVKVPINTVGTKEEQKQTEVKTTVPAKAPAPAQQTSTAKPTTSTSSATKSTTKTTNSIPKPVNPASNPTSIPTPTQPTNNQPTNTIPPVTSTTSNNTTTAPSEPVVTGKMVTVHRSNGMIEQIALEDYIVGVVAGEMPASFQTEALKAQALAARTYALARVDTGKILYDTDASQVYKDINQMKALWGNGFNTYYNKIRNAVNATKGEYITYNGKYIDAVFFSTSNGATEDAAAVWGNSFPYLVSVDSHWDLSVSGFQQDKVQSINVVDQLTGLNITGQSTIQILSKTPGGRINTISIDGTIFTGKHLRELLGLRSTDFDIKVENGNVTFTTRGYGHGVGMSQYGANGMAKEGYSYRGILSHYYPGTSIKAL